MARTRALPPSPPDPLSRQRERGRKNGGKTAISSLLIITNQDQPHRPFSSPRPASGRGAGGEGLARTRALPPSPPDPCSRQRKKGSQAVGGGLQKIGDRARAVVSANACFVSVENGRFGPLYRSAQSLRFSHVRSPRVL